MLTGKLGNRNSLLWLSLVVPTVLLAAAALGAFASWRMLAVTAAAVSGVLVLRQPSLGLFGLVTLALLIPLDISTGTDVSLNLTTLLVPGLCAVWVVTMVRQKRIALVESPVNLPLALFLLAAIVALLIGNVTWDPMVPKRNGFLLVQLSQVALFAFSAGAFWLSANLIGSVLWLRRLTLTFLFVAGTLAILYLIPITRQFITPLTTIAIVRTPFWILLAGLAGGLALFDRSLNRSVRVFLALVLLTCALYAFVQQRESASNWVGVGAAAAILLWLRWPRVRWFVLIMVLVLLASGILFPTIWNFAGGELEWRISGGSRLVLIERVVEDTMRNPVTGLGPAAYRLYGMSRPLAYQRAFYVAPSINSHNNYVDVFSHMGLVGLALLAWIVVALTRTGLRLRQDHTADFQAGYASGMLAAGAGGLAVMFLADWILPFVYNIGFPGFQASVLLWLFLGGLVVLERYTASDPPTTAAGSDQANP